jgi:DNA-binding HxlR family transcriptional regulator
MPKATSTTPAAAAAAPKPEPACQIVRSLDVVGEKWSLLIVRNALRGQTRFSEFKEGLGIPSDILAARLVTLVEGGILEKRSYREPGSRERSSYHLTERGQGLRIVMAAFMQWNDEYTPYAKGAASLMADAATHETVHLSYVKPDGQLLTNADVTVVPGPAATSFWAS